MIKELQKIYLESTKLSDGNKLPKTITKRYKQRLLEGKRKKARIFQIEVLQRYKRQCESWKKSNENWIKAPKKLTEKQSEKCKQIQGPQLMAGLKVGHVNIRSLLSLKRNEPYKFLKLQACLAELKYDVFVVGESQINGIDDSQLHIPRYEMYRLDREYTGVLADCASGGGLLVYVRDSVEVKKAVLKNVLGSNLMQYIHLKLVYNNKTIHVVAVYNPPHTGREDAILDILYNYSQKQDVVILGDININILGGNNHEYQRCFGTKKGGLGFLQCINEVTRWDSKTLIDHVYFKAKNWKVLQSGVIPPGPKNQLEGFADHKIIYCTLV